MTLKAINGFPIRSGMTLLRQGYGGQAREKRGIANREGRVYKSSSASPRIEYGAGSLIGRT